MTDDPLMKPYYSRRNELTNHRGCLMWGIKVIIPVKLRERVLSLLHVSHPGIVRMKSLAKSYVWWPGIDSDLEHLSRRCNGCLMEQKSPAKVQLHPWEWPTQSFERIHVDYAGPFLGQMFFWFSRCPLKMARNRCNEIHNYRENNTSSSNNFCHERIT